jgi:ABC-2 type transport system ATP-binding protein
MTRTIESGPATGACALGTHGLSKRYGGAMALDRVDLRVPEGAVYVLVGANGAGKSTSFRVLMNLVRPDSGSAEVFGMDPGRRGADVRAQVGYVPDGRDHAYPRMTCGRLLQHVAVFYPAWDAAYASHLSRAFELQPDRRVGTLSRGEARRLHLVLALAHRPPLLLLDEPTDGLDPVVRRTALALLAEHIADTPTTVLISTHQIREVESLADHVGVLRAGRLTSQMSRDEVRRTVRRYEIEVPEGWEPPPGLRMAGLRRSSTGREIRGTLVGEEREVVERLTLVGGRVREAKPLSLEDATLALLTEECTG